jgi:hypothetical protein
MKTPPKKKKVGKVRAPAAAADRNQIKNEERLVRTLRYLAESLRPIEQEVKRIWGKNTDFQFDEAAFPPGLFQRLGLAGDDDEILTDVLSVFAGNYGGIDAIHAIIKEYDLNKKAPVADVDEDEG